MKKILSTLVALVCATATFAQVSEVQTATLIHGDKTSVFYGTNALQDAYNAAADTADVIILSNGTYPRLNNISKSVSIYGSGMDNNADISLNATICRGFTIEQSEYYDDYGEKQFKTPVVHLEGLCIDNGTTGAFYEYLYGIIVNNPNTPLRNLNIVKCSVRGIIFNGDIVDCTIRQSRSWQYINAKNHKMESLNIYNSFVMGISQVPIGSTVLVDHCILGTSSCSIGYYTNNIVIKGYIEAQSTCYNNIFTGKTDNNYMGSPNIQEGNWFNIDNEVLWAVEGEDGSYGPTKTYELKFPKKYVGTDGTVVGPAGGQYPWNVVPSLPRIVSSDIDARVAADGQLKVSLKVEAQTKE